MTMLRGFKQSHASFIGKNNESKCKALLVLLWHQREGHRKGLTHGEVVKKAGIPYNSFRAGKFHEWNYISRETIHLKGRQPCYAYNIALRGKLILARVPNDVMDRYIREIKGESNDNNSENQYEKRTQTTIR